MVKKKKSLKWLQKKAWTLISIVVRKSPANFQDLTECYTCGRSYPWKEMNAGHYWHGKLDFDLRNLKPQCVYCNKWKHGNLGKYGARLIREHGQKWYDQLERDAAQHKGYKRDELEVIIEKYKTA